MSKKSSIFARKIACEMKLLLVLLSAMMTFTVDTKSKVTADGTWPGSMSATYQNTGRKGDVTDKDTATLTVSGLDGIMIEKVEVYLKSNKSSGAGVITMRADWTEIYRAEGTFKEWFDAYDNENYHAIGWSGEQTVNELMVQVTGTTNSLHIEKYEITWTQASMVHEVTLMNGTETVETLRGETVVLPSMPDTVNWHFVGWTVVPFYALDVVLHDLIGAGVYRPSADITLWAVYAYETPVEELAVTELQDGIYVYADMSRRRAMSGGVVDGEAEANPVDLQDLMQHYEITFDIDGKAYIRLLYVYGEEYIGYEGNRLANIASGWEVYHEGSTTAFYTTYNNKVYMLYPNKLNEQSYTYSTVLQEVNDIAMAETALLETEGAFDVQWTCYPQVPFDVELTNEGMKELTNEWVIPFGNYELVIRNGRKELRLKE